MPWEGYPEDSHDPTHRMTPLTPANERPTYVRYAVLTVLFLATTINYADRGALGVVGEVFKRQLGLSAPQLGFVLSAFSITYVAMQIPGGWILDRFGSRRVYAWSLGLWSAATLLQGLAGQLGSVSLVLYGLFGLRLLLGFAEAPSFPANGRIVATWFPAAERGFASAVFNAAQYAATILFSPLLGMIALSYGWQWVFVTMGALGLALWVFLPKFLRPPREQSWANPAEVAHIERGGGLVDIDSAPRRAFAWGDLWQLLNNRMLMGIYLGQYCVNVLTYFFLTWYPAYLMNTLHISVLKAGALAAVPAILGLVGGLYGGYLSDSLLRRGWSLTAARKLPTVGGLLLCGAILGCLYVHTPLGVIVVTSIAYFGKGVGSLGWALVADVSPKQITGLCGSVFNTFGNIGGIVTPLAIGWILKETQSYSGAIVFVAAHSVIGALCFLVLMGRVERLRLRS